MKRILSIIIGNIIFISLMAQAKKVAIFEPVGDVSGGIRIVIREEISNVVVNAEGYIALERTLIEKVMEENKFQMSGQVDDSQIGELGKKMGANYVCIASVTALDDNFYVSCKLIDVTTAKVDKQQTGMTKNGEGELMGLTSRIASKMFLPNYELRSVEEFKKTSQIKKSEIKVEHVIGLDGDEIGRLFPHAILHENKKSFLYRKKLNLFFEKLSGIESDNNFKFNYKSHFKPAVAALKSVPRRNDFDHICFNILFAYACGKLSHVTENNFKERQKFSSLAGKHFEIANSIIRRKYKRDEEMKSAFNSVINDIDSKY